MTIRIAAVGVSHWHALNDAAYLRHLIAMPDVELVAIQDSDASIVARRAAEVGNPPTFTDYHDMLTTLRPDFVIALGRHRQMAAIAHDLLDAGYPFLMEKPMGISAAEVEAVAAKAARLNAFVAVPLAQRYAPFARRARALIDAGRFGPLSHIYVRINRPGPARYPAWDCAWMLDPAEAGGGALRNLGPHGLDMFLHLTGEAAQVTGAQLSRRAHERAVEDYASVMLRSASGVLGTVGRQRLSPRRHRRRMEGRRPRRHPHHEGRRLEACHCGRRRNLSRHRHHRALFHRRARCARPLAARRPAADQRARLRPRGAADRPGLRAGRSRVVARME